MSSVTPTLEEILEKIEKGGLDAVSNEAQDILKGHRYRSKIYPSELTVLEYAIRQRKTQIAEMLIKAGANVFIDNPLFSAAFHNQTNVIKALLSRNVFVNDQSQDSAKTTALHYAVMKATRTGDTETIEILLDAGANPLIANYNKETPLDMAKAYESYPNRDEIIKLLEKNKVQHERMIVIQKKIDHAMSDPKNYDELRKVYEEVEITIEDWDPKTASHLMNNIRQQIFKKLLKYLNEVNSEGFDILMAALPKEEAHQILAYQYHGKTLFDHAIENPQSYRGFIINLIKAGAIASPGSKTPLMWAIEKLESKPTMLATILHHLKPEQTTLINIIKGWGNKFPYEYIVPVIDQLIHSGLNISALFESHIDVVETLLLHAIYTDNLDLVKQIIKNPNISKIINKKRIVGTFETEESPLSTAIMKGNFEMIEFLVQAGADPNLTYENGESLLFKFLPNAMSIPTDKLAPIIQWIFNQKIDLLKSDSKGETIFHKLAYVPEKLGEGKENENKFAQLLQFLSSRMSLAEKLKLMTTQSNDTGCTPLFISLPEGHGYGNERFKLYLDLINYSGLPVAEKIKILELRNNYGNTLLLYAIKEDNFEAFKLLELEKLPENVLPQFDSLKKEGITPEKVSQFFKKCTDQKSTNVLLKIFKFSNEDLFNILVNVRNDPNNFSTLFKALSDRKLLAEISTFTLANTGGKESLFHLIFKIHPPLENAFELAKQLLDQDLSPTPRELNLTPAELKQTCRNIILLNRSVHGLEEKDLKDTFERQTAKLETFIHLFYPARSQENELKGFLNSQDNQGQTILDIALKQIPLNTDLIIKLIEKGASVGPISSDPLSTAIRYGNVKLVNFLLARKETAELLTREYSNGETNLMLAIRTSGIKDIQDSMNQIINALINHGADLFKVTKNGNHCLLLALDARNPTLLQFILDKPNISKLINQKRTTNLGYEISPLYMALYDANFSLVDQLIGLGASPNLTYQHGNTLLIDYIAANIYKLNSIKDEIERKHAFEAVDKAITFLLAHKVNLSQVNRKGQNVLHVILEHMELDGSDDTKFIEIISLMKSKIPENEFIKLLMHPDNNGQSPLDYALIKKLNGAFVHYLKLVNYATLTPDKKVKLLQRTDEQGKTLLHHAIESGNLEFVKLLQIERLAAELPEEMRTLLTRYYIKENLKTLEITIATGSPLYSAVQVVRTVQTETKEQADVSRLQKQGAINRSNAVLPYLLAILKSLPGTDDANNLDLAAPQGLADYAQLDASLKHIHAFLQNKFVQPNATRQFSVSTEAHKLIWTKEETARVEKELNFRLYGSETAMDKQEILAANKHFDETIVPAFKSKFNATSGATKQEKIANIEQQIRESILTKIKQHLKSDLSNPKLVDSKTTEDLERASKIREKLKFIDENLNFLIKGDPGSMLASRQYLTATDDTAEIAWRCYDPGAKTLSWPNLFTHSDKQIGVFSTRESNPTPLSQEQASDNIRERTAYYYLCAMDDSEEEIEGQSIKSGQDSRLERFIASLAEVRRAHNNKSSELDDPSCFPGHLTRLARSTVEHPKYAFKEYKTVRQLTQEYMNTVITACFADSIEAVKEKVKKKFAPEIDPKEANTEIRQEILKLLRSLAMLDQNTAYRLSINPFDDIEEGYPSDLLEYRDHFKLKLAEKLKKLREEFKKEMIATFEKKSKEIEKQFADEEEQLDKKSFEMYEKLYAEIEKKYSGEELTKKMDILVIQYDENLANMRHDLYARRAKAIEKIKPKTQDSVEDYIFKHAEREVALEELHPVTTYVDYALANPGGKEVYVQLSELLNQLPDVKEEIDPELMKIIRDANIRSSLSAALFPSMMLKLKANIDELTETQGAVLKFTQELSNKLTNKLNDTNRQHLTIGEVESVCQAIQVNNELSKVLINDTAAHQTILRILNEVMQKIQKEFPLPEPQLKPEEFGNRLSQLSESLSESLSEKQNPTPDQHQPKTVPSTTSSSSSQSASLPAEPYTPLMQENKERKEPKELEVKVKEQSPKGQQPKGN